MFEKKGKKEENTVCCLYTFCDGRASEFGTEEKK